MIDLVMDLVESIGVGGGSIIAIGSGVVTFIGKRQSKKQKEELAKFEARDKARAEFAKLEDEELRSRCSVVRTDIFDALEDELESKSPESLFEAKRSVRLQSVKASMSNDVMLLMTDSKAKEAMNHDALTWYKKQWKRFPNYADLDTSSLEESIDEDARRFRDVFVTRFKKDAGKSNLRNAVINRVFSYEKAQELYDGMVRYSIRERVSLERELAEIEAKRILG